MLINNGTKRELSSKYWNSVRVTGHKGSITWGHDTENKEHTDNDQCVITSQYNIIYIYEGCPRNT